jgi:LCP family protein required for cell wall assembly
MVAPPQALAAATDSNRWGSGVVGAGTAKRKVVIDGGSASAPAGAAAAAVAAPRPVAPAAGAAGAPPQSPPAQPMPRPQPQPPPPAARQAPPRVKRPRRRRRVGRTILLLCVLLPLVLIAGGFAFGWMKFNQIPRVPVADVLSPQAGSGTNFLVVGTDSREGINPGDPNADAFIGGGGSTGARTDSIMVLRVDGAEQSILSIPRDLWVTDPATGQLGRINSTYNAGPANLIQTVQSLGIPVHHYIEINFVSFGKLVDAVGGIDVTFANPSRDTASGLVIEEAGTHHLDGTQALAYVRSRHFEELKDGVWVEDPLSDLGRVARQRAFLASLLTEVTSSKNPFEISSITDAMAVGMKLDDAMTFLDALQLGWQFRGGFNPASDTLPVTPRTTSGGAAVLDLNQAEAAPLIAQYQ